jgi:exopolyphosphatase/guanosine-5'-triphosphate,3'-diphosphate pyrophosphatase
VVASPPLDRSVYTAEELLRDVVGQVDALRAVVAHKRRTHYVVDSCGLQPNRAEVILAGACVVRAVSTKFGCESLVVSDRGLSHWLIADRLGLGPAGAER